LTDNTFDIDDVEEDVECDDITVEDEAAVSSLDDRHFFVGS
jgi:hypothetical protein